MKKICSISGGAAEVLLLFQMCWTWRPLVTCEIQDSWYRHRVYISFLYFFIFYWGCKDNFC